MNIEEAIAEFESQHHKKYSALDRKKILEVVGELGITEFIVTKDHISNIKTGKVNIANEIGIHSTMIVAGMPYAGSFDRGVDPYPHRTHHYKLEGWQDAHGRGKEGGGQTKAFCDGVAVTAGIECPYCGLIHNAE